MSAEGPMEFFRLGGRLTSPQNTYLAKQGTLSVGISGYADAGMSLECISSIRDTSIRPTTPLKHTLPDTPLSTGKRFKEVISCLAAETDETKRLSTDELQRLVLLEQLKLIGMQQQEIEGWRTAASQKYFVDEVTIVNKI
ncbi:unnamed protein product [Timema podura]|uniref:Uncharacterized protein n=1 Tax=Timema podura TaxID=61482 RepID=A0ABN7P3P9_TIMPD|nr:unnamed protein product [Timema podura]